MLDLTLDTSTDPHFVFLSEGKKIIASELLQNRSNLSVALLPVLEKLLFQTGKTVSDLSRIFIGIGPGSYTGVRVGLAVATALSLARDIPLYPFCSLLAFLPENLPEGPFTLIAGSNHGTFFLLHGRLENDLPCKITHELTSENDLTIKLHPESHLIALNNKKILDLPRLLSYLTELAKSPPKPPVIHYLHEL